MTTIKVLFAHHDSSISGSGKSLRNLLANLDRCLFEPRVLLASEGPARELFEPLGIKVDVVPAFSFGTFPGPLPYKLSWLLNWRSYLPNLLLKKYFRSIEWDLLHINDKAFISAGLAAKKFNKPIVWHSRSSYFPTYSRLNAWASMRTIRSIANRIIAISEDEVDGFENFEKLDIIYNTVDFSEVDVAINAREDTRRKLGLSGKDILIGQVSTTIGAVRGTWDFLNACGEIKKALTTQNIKFIIVAKIPLLTTGITLKKDDLDSLEKTKRLALKNKISEDLIMTGFQKDVLKLIAAMDVIVVCNRHGVLGRMPFEAMAVGCPPVVTAGHSGRSKIVIEKKTALIVPPLNPNAIANAVVEIIQNPSLSKNLSDNGRIYARMNFDPQKNARKIEQIYLELLSKK